MTWPEDAESAVEPVVEPVVGVPAGGGADLAEAVAPDGSPVAVYLVAPGRDDAALIDAEIPFSASVLDLGCGAGRIAHQLADLGHDVVGVDESEAMIAQLRDDVEGVVTRIEDLDLPRRFDVVLLMSHLINVIGRKRRHALLAACARHVAAGGVVLVQRYPVGWLRNLDVQTGRIGDVEITMSVAGWQADTFSGEVVYRLGDRTWTQHFEGEAVDDEALDEALTQAGLHRDAQLDAAGSWVRARPLR